METSGTVEANNINCPRKAMASGIHDITSYGGLESQVVFTTSHLAAAAANK